MPRFLYVDPNLTETCLFEDSRLDDCIDRHKLILNLPLRKPSQALRQLQNHKIDGVVIGMRQGWLGRAHLKLVKEALKSSNRVWVHWPLENVVERFDELKLRSHWCHWGVLQLFRRGKSFRSRLLGGLNSERPSEDDDAFSGPDSVLVDLEEVITRAGSIPLKLESQPSGADPIPGTGLYLRTDFWARIESGGSYGHTCYVAKSLAAVTQKLVCIMAHRYTLLDEMGLEQIVLAAPGPHGNEETILGGTQHYHQLLKQALNTEKLAYIYERLCLGNYAGALLSQQLGVPYLVEYTGSEISMKRSFEGRGYDYEKIYLKAEEAAFQQATLISVVSEHVKTDLVARGIDPAKILVNPNGVDLESYAPLPADRKRALRRDLGFEDSQTVIGFTGTFGGWHGVDILAAALPEICRRLPDARLLLIGDGNYKHLVDEAVKKHRLSKQVMMTGRVPQRKGARLLAACDLFVSPHNSHMVDSRFFGSPTKIFEYMSIGGGIVASKLEQIGQVLSPALRPADLEKPDLRVSNQRSVLLTPGDVDEFTDAVTCVARRPEVYRALGENARRAIADYYSWDQHVANLWSFSRGEALHRDPSLKVLDRPASRIDRSSRIQTGDAYKEQTQDQWDSDPAGSHYVKNAKQHTLQWFKEAEAYRYGEYAPWMPKTMEFALHEGKDLLEVGGGMGTDLCQFALNGARVTDLDLSAGHLALARENFELRGLKGKFIHHDAEDLPFPDESYDVVYSNGVIHHTPNTRRVVEEMFRVLRPGGRVLVMVYARHSLHYWRNLFRDLALKQGQIEKYSIGEIMSRHAELGENAKPLVKVYSKQELKKLFKQFTKISIVQRQLIAAELPRRLRWMPLETAGKLMGWNLVLNANKPDRS